MIVDDFNSEQQLRLPRILCLHGGGTNSRIFRAQCRVLRTHLSTTFRLVFAEAPFSSRAGSDVMSVYKDWKPFKSWVIPPENNQHLGPDGAIHAIESSLNTAMEEDDRGGGIGEWIGLLGFSQGAKTCASLLLSQQLREERLGVFPPRVNWRFAILLAGSGPLMVLDRDLLTPELTDASHTSLATISDGIFSVSNEHVLYLPTVHVHGIRDPGLLEHRKLLAQYCEPESTRLMEWDGDHRVPIKTQDVLTLVRHILDTAYETGVLGRKPS
jgi:predicted esterase